MEICLCQEPGTKRDAWNSYHLKGSTKFAFDFVCFKIMRCLSTAKRRYGIGELITCFPCTRVYLESRTCEGIKRQKEIQPGA